MKTALFLCPSWDAKGPNFALVHLAAVLKQRGHEADCYDLNRAVCMLDKAAGAELKHYGVLSTDWTDPFFVRQRLELDRRYIEGVVDRVLDEGVRVVGFSAYFSNRLMSLEVARLFKKRDPGIVVVFGGADCFRLEMAQHYARQEGVDAVVYGEGEIALTQLLDGLAKNGRLTPVAGAMLAADPSTWRPSREQVEDLDSLPFADYGACRLGVFRRKMLSSCRGCVRRCEFCTDWRMMRYRQMSGERIFSEFEHQLERHPQVRDFLFADSLINGVMSELERFCDLIIDSGLSVRWEGFAIVRPEMNERFFRKMRRAGCWKLNYGIESGSEKVRRDMKKGFDNALASRVLSDCAAAGIATAIGWIVGYPSETEEDFDKSLDFIRRNAASISIIGPAVFSTYELHGQEERYALPPIVHDTYWASKDGSNTFPLRLERLRRLSREIMSCGIEMAFEGHVAASDLDTSIARMRQAYESWRP